MKNNQNPKVGKKEETESGGWPESKEAKSTGYRIYDECQKVQQPGRILKRSNREKRMADYSGCSSPGDRDQEQCGSALSQAGRKR